MIQPEDLPDKDRIAARKMLIEMEAAVIAACLPLLEQPTFKCNKDTNPPEMVDAGYMCATVSMPIWMMDGYTDEQLATLGYRRKEDGSYEAIANG